MAAAPAAAQYSEERTDNDPTHHSFSIGFWRRWRVLRTFSLGSCRRGWFRTGDNFIDSPHSLHVGDVSTKVTTGDEFQSKQSFPPLMKKTRVPQTRQPAAGQTAGVALRPARRGPRLTAVLLVVDVHVGSRAERTMEFNLVEVAGGFLPRRD